MNMKKIAVIPARGGSKRIPRKNIRLFCGMPIIAYSIQAAHRSKCFDRIIVSTDDEEIADIAYQYGAEVPFLRSKELSDDFTVVTDVVIDVINYVENELHERIDYACLIYATAPMIDANTIRQGFEEIVSLKKKFAIGVTNYAFPVERALKIRDGKISQLFDKRNSRSQDLEEYYHDAAHFCWGSIEAFKERYNFFSSESIPIFIPRISVQDIDTIEDWNIAEILYKSFHSKE